MGITKQMYLKNKIINGKKYIYAVKTLRLPNGKHISIEKLYKNQSKKELEEYFTEKIIEEHTKYSLKEYKTDHIFTKEEVRKIESVKIGYKKIKKKLSKVSLNDLINRFTANFTYESNALEGNSLTLKDVAIVLFENLIIKGKDLREIYETRNSRIVVENIIKGKYSILEKDIIKIHKTLVKDIKIQEGYKKVPNFIQGRNIETTPPEIVKKKMDKLIEWYIENKEKFHPLKLAANFHGKFEQIHPFEDGNGRVGRFLINVILKENNYPPLIIRKSQRISYLNALEKFDQKHPDNLERFILERFKETYKKFFEVYIKYL